jgi:hypothetical protein
MKKLIPFLFLGVGILLMSLTQSMPSLRNSYSADSLSEFVGVYKMGDNGYIKDCKVTLKEGFLYLEADQNGENKLLKQDKPDTFKSTSQYGSIITFKRNPDTKKVIGLSMMIQDNELMGDKQ